MDCFRGKLIASDRLLHKSLSKQSESTRTLPAASRQQLPTVGARRGLRQKAALTAQLEFLKALGRRATDAGIAALLEVDGFRGASRSPAGDVD
jgi:hypothetical protein